MTTAATARLGIAPKQLGMWLFVASDGVTFSTLLAVYAYLHWTRTGWPAALPQAPSGGAALALTVVLVASGVAMARGWLWATIGCGTAFLALHLMEWRHLLAGGQCPGHPFFALTGLHMLHVGAGVACLAFLAMRKAAAEDIAVCRLYWYFVDAVWLVLCPLVYLG